MHYTIRGGMLWLFTLYSIFSVAQSGVSPNEAQAFTRDACVRYALKHSPRLQQTVTDQRIVQKEVAASLSGWLPQVSVAAGLTNNVDKPNIVFPDEQGNPVVREIGVAYQSNVTLNAEQTLFSNEVLSAARAAPLARTQAEQNTQATQIEVYVAVSKAFFDLLTTLDQVSILSEDLNRLQKNVRDARLRYENGVVDNVDYKQATIQLNNARAQLESTRALLPYRRAVLRQSMGYAANTPLEIEYNRDQLRNEVGIDTTQSFTYRQRIEYSLLETQSGLLAADISRFRWGFLPRFSAFANYQYGYFSEELSPLYDRAFTSAQIGLRALVPLFQGAQRIHNLQAAKLQAERLGYVRTELKNQITSEYAQARAIYQGAYASWELQQKNEQLAQEVYQTIQLQYDEGLIPYIEVIQAETDLRSAQLNTSETLLQVLSSKIDVQQASGQVPLELVNNEE